MFNQLETDDDEDTVELYVNTGIYTLPLFEGPVIADFINTVAKQFNPYDYILRQLQSEVPPIRIKDNNGVIIKMVDNQRDGHLKEKVGANMSSLKYIPEEKKEAYVYDFQVENELKRAPKISKLLPKGKKVKKMKEELIDILKSEYSGIMEAGF